MELSTREIPLLLLLAVLSGVMGGVLRRKVAEGRRVQPLLAVLILGGRRLLAPLRLLEQVLMGVTVASLLYGLVMVTVLLVVMVRPEVRVMIVSGRWSRLVEPSGGEVCLTVGLVLRLLTVLLDIEGGGR